MWSLAAIVAALLGLLTLGAPILSRRSIRRLTGLLVGLLLLTPAAGGQGLLRYVQHEQCGIAGRMAHPLGSARPKIGETTYSAANRKGWCVLIPHSIVSVSSLTPPGPAK